MTIDTFAEKFRLKITRDECGDRIIEGRRGHIYVDAGQVCAMWLNTTPILKTRLMPLGGKLWMGDVSLLHGKRVQDIWIKDIRPEQIRLLIRLPGCKKKRIPSEAQLAVLAKASSLLPPKYRHRDKLLETE